MIKNKKKGFTLVELIVVMAIMTVVLSIIFQIYTFYYRTYSSGMNINNVQSTRTKVMYDVGESISEAKKVDITVRDNNFTLKTSSNVIIGTGKEKVAITSADSAEMQYCYVIYGDVLYKCKNISADKSSSSDCSEIAHNVSALQLDSVGSGNLYSIDLTVKGNIQVFKTNIAMKNMGVE